MGGQEQAETSCSLELEKALRYSNLMLSRETTLRSIEIDRKRRQRNGRKERVEGLTLESQSSSFVSPSFPLSSTTSLHLPSIPLSSSPSAACLVPPSSDLD